jgi:hypothetical protein
MDAKARPSPTADEALHDGYPHRNHKTIHPSTDWLNHVQMSPTDPSLIMFCHEGPWHLLDRVWRIHTDGTALKLIHPRTMVMEIAGHEFFSADGKTIWYDLQTPRGQTFWLAGYEIQTGNRTWYQLQRDEWSVHYNISPDLRASSLSKWRERSHDTTTRPNVSRIDFKIPSRMLLACRSCLAHPVRSWIPLMMDFGAPSPFSYPPAPWLHCPRRS